VQLLAEQRKIDEVEENRLELVADLGTLVRADCGRVGTPWARR
jgi:hypothetical protein